MRNSDYIVIQGFMVSELNLSGNRLIVYAIIHGFSKDCVHEFSGSLSYICKWTNLSKNTVISTLNSLVEDGLISKREYEINGVKFCSYKICTGSAEIAPPYQKLNGGSAEIAPHINNNDKTIVRDTCVSHEDESRLSPPKEELDFEEFAKFFNSTMADKAIKPISKFTPKRKTAVRARMREYGKKALGDVIKKAAASDFLNGKSQRGWTADFDWLFKPNNFPKVLEGNYDNRENVNLNTNQGNRYEQRNNEVQQRAAGAAALIARLEAEERLDD